MKIKIYVYFVIFLLVISGCKNEDRIGLTPISIKEINEIGELISAEYYGEVVESLSEIYLETNSGSLENDYNLIKKKYLQIAKDVKASNLGEKKRNFFRTDLKKEKEKEYDLFKTIWEEKQQKKAHRFFLDSISRSTWQQFNTTYGSKIEDYLTKVVKKDLKKAELVYLGRGWVKVGYDLAKLDTAMFAANGDTLFIRNFNPIIVAADINPWYIPDNDTTDVNYYGFEIIYDNKPKKITFDQITMVKAACKQKLIKDALERDVYKKAKQNAEESLFNLFKLMHLYEYFEYNHLRILHKKYFEIEHELLYDNKIDSLEVIKVASLYQDQSVQSNEIKYPSYWHENFEEQKLDLDQFMNKIRLQTKNKFNHPTWDIFWTNITNNNTSQ